MNNVRIPILALCALLSGCASVYQEPVDGPMARIRVNSFDRGDVDSVFALSISRNVMFFPNTACRPSLLKADPRSGYMLHYKGFNRSTMDEVYREVSVSANGNPMVLGYNYVRKDFSVKTSCKLSLSFTPKANRDYVANVYYDYTGKKCYGNIMDMTVPPGEPVLTDKTGAC